MTTNDVGQTSPTGKNIDKLEANLARVEELTQRLLKVMGKGRAVPAPLQGPSPDLYAKAATAYWTEMINNPAFGHVYAPNLTAGQGSVVNAYKTEDWVGAIRHGIDPRGRALLIMPSMEYTHLSNEDLAAMVAFLAQVPPVNRPSLPQSPGPVMYTLVTFRDDLFSAATIDHDAPRPAVPRGVTIEYGAYLAANCMACMGMQSMQFAALGFH